LTALSSSGWRWSLLVPITPAISPSSLPMMQSIRSVEAELGNCFSVRQHLPFCKYQKERIFK
jgi:hypothetical protein